MHALDNGHVVWGERGIRKLVVWIFRSFGDTTRREGGAMRPILCIVIAQLFDCRGAIIVIVFILTRGCGGKNSWAGDNEEPREYRARGQNAAHRSEQNHMDEAWGSGLSAGVQSCQIIRPTTQKVYEIAEFEGLAMTV